MSDMVFAVDKEGQWRLFCIFRKLEYSGSGDLYRQAGGWKLFKHIVEMEDTGISSATLNDKAEKTNDEWYDLNGCRLNGQPTRKGVYIQKGKKHVF